MSQIRRAADDYLQMRRALGYKLQRQGHQLREFVCYLEQAGANTITIDHALTRATQPTGADPGYWNDRLSVARQFATRKRADHQQPRHTRVSSRGRAGVIRGTCVL